MDVQKVLHMNGGAGETSYAQNSTIQRVIVSLTKAARQEAAANLCSRALPECLSIVDLGCSSGPNALLVVSDIVEAVEQRCLKLRRQPPEFQLLLNDLPFNDFNTIFSSVPDFLRQREHADEGRRRRGRCFVSGVPGSFYGRLFPSKSLHFVHSSSSLHWLSRVPPELQGGGAGAGGRPLNKGKMYISETSPPSVSEAYLKQFQSDFLYFLNCRAEEVVQGGQMVVTMMGRRGADAPSLPKYTFQWELLARVLMEMASEGKVEEEKVASFAAPYYAPSEEELKHLLEEGQRSFSVWRMSAFQASWHEMEVDEEDCGHAGAGLCPGRGRRSMRSVAELKAKVVRAVVESMLQSHFGRGVMDELFERYVGALEDHFSTYTPEVINIVLTMVRN